MAKVAIIGDLHFGVRSGNEDFFDFQAGYIDNFMDDCVAKGVSHIVNPGDFFDVRKSMNIRVLDYVRKRFAKKVKATGLTWHMVPGNHDIFLKHSNALTAMRAFDGLEGVKVYESAGDYKIGDEVCMMLPWLDESNTRCLPNFLKQAKAKFMFGHLEMAGFPMYANSMAEHGMPLSTFEQFERVWSGHYHTISERQNLTYLGSPYHLTWGDVPDGTNRGWFLWDQEAKTSVLQKNEPWMSMFGVYEYEPTVDENVQTLTDKIGNKIIKVLVKDKPNAKHFKDFIKVLNQVDVIEYRIIDETVVVNKTVQIKEADLQLDTRDVFTKYIDGQEDGMFDKDAVKVLMTDILARAQETV